MNVAQRRWLIACGRMAMTCACAAETDHQVADDELLARANAENRIIVTEDFDFGDLLVRDQLPATGVIILYLPKMEPDGRAERLAAILADPAFDPSGRLTIIEGRRVRQRALDLS